VSALGAVIAAANTVAKQPRSPPDNGDTLKTARKAFQDLDIGETDQWALTYATLLWFE
jgi:hypothetical protein